jgi:hypothetical protein
LGALGVALMRGSSTLCLINLGALLKTATNAMNGTLTRLGLRRQRAVTTTVSLLAEASAVVAVSVLRAIIQAGSDITSIARPSGVAVTLPLDTLSVSTAALSISRAASIAVSASPSIHARALAIEALSMSRASIALLIFLSITVAVLLGAVITSVFLVTDALHLVSDSNTLSVSRTRRRARRQGAVDASEARLAKARSVVAHAVSCALLGAGLK